MPSPNVPSPCVKLCTYVPEVSICTGCGRTLDEIWAWSTASPDRQRQIVKAAGARLQALDT